MALKASKPTSNTPATSSFPRLVTERDVAVREALIAEIRGAFIQAPPGEFPSVQKILKRLKGTKGEIASCVVTEQEVRAIMEQEGWKRARVEYLESCTPVPAEVDFLRLRWNIEIHEMLYETLRLQHRVNRQIYCRGYATTLSGERLPITQADPEAIALLAKAVNEIGLALRRQVDTGTQSRQPGQCSSHASSELTQAGAAYSQMTKEELALEIERLERLAGLREA